MGKTLVLLFVLFATLDSYGQNYYTIIKDLDKNEVDFLLGTINAIEANKFYAAKYSQLPEKKYIDDLKLFLLDPFDKNIKNLDLSKSILMAINVYTTMDREVSDAKSVDEDDDTDTDGDGVADFFDAVPPASVMATAGSIPTGMSSSTAIIQALSDFLVERTKQELTLTFFETFKTRLKETIVITIGQDTITISLKELFYNTYILLESQNYFETPSFGRTWIMAFKRDLLDLPFKMEYLIKANTKLAASPEGHFALVSFDAINELKKGKHPMLILESLDDSYNADRKSTHEIDMVIGLLRSFSENLVVTVTNDAAKAGERRWITVDELRNLDDHNVRYLMGHIYQQVKARNPKIGNLDFEDIADKEDFTALLKMVRSTLQQLNDTAAILEDLKENTDADKTATVKQYLGYINTFYTVFDETLENYHVFMKSSNYFASDYYTKYKPIVQDITAFNEAVSDADYAQCLLLTNRFLKHVIPEDKANKAVITNVTYYGNFLVDVITTVENKGNLKNVIESYVMPVSSYRIKRQHAYSWDVSAYPGMYLAYEFSQSNSFSYGVTAPIGISYSRKNSAKDDLNTSASSSTLFLSVIDIGAPFGYRFMNDEAEGLPEAIQWEQVFAPGLSYIYGFKNSPLSLGINAQFCPLLRKIEENNQLDAKNIFRVGLNLMVDIPLFNLKKSEL